jgi:hypothetical protein
MRRRLEKSTGSICTAAEHEWHAAVTRRSLYSSATHPHYWVHLRRMRHGMAPPAGEHTAVMRGTALSTHMPRMLHPAHALLWHAPCM